jgi:hypothetical protein
MEQIKIDILKEHLPYELDMLDEAAAYAGSTEAAETHTRKGPAWFKRNAAIEAFWTHARNLIEFLEREKSPDLNVSSASAKDFTDSFHFTLEIKNLKDKINAQICRLGYGRTIVDYEKLGHEISYVKPALDSQIKRFEAKLDFESRKHWAQRTPSTVRGPDKATHTALAAKTASFTGTGPAHGRSDSEVAATFGNRPRSGCEGVR